MKENLIILSMIIMLTVVAIIGVGFSDKVQKYIIRQSTDRSKMWRMNPFIEWMKTSSYLLTIRIIGVFSFVIAIFLIYILLN